MTCALFLAFYLVTINAITFVLYWTDKALARSGSQRISEQTLLLTGLIGGTPGGFAAQRLFRHKTRKTSFQIAFWATVAVQLAVLAALTYRFTHAGA